MHLLLDMDLDYAERYRNLPYIGVLKPEIYRTNQLKGWHQEKTAVLNYCKSNYFLDTI